MHSQTELVGRNALQVQWLQSPLTVTALAWFENVPSYHWTRLWTISLLHSYSWASNSGYAASHGKTMRSKQRHYAWRLKKGQQQGMWEVHLWPCHAMPKRSKRPLGKGPDQWFWGRTRSDTHMFGGFSPWVNYKAPWVHDARKWRGGLYWNWLDTQWNFWSPGFPCHVAGLSDIVPSQICKNWRVQRKFLPHVAAIPTLSRCGETWESRNPSPVSSWCALALKELVRPNFTWRAKALFFSYLHIHFSNYWFKLRLPCHWYLGSVFGWRFERNSMWKHTKVTGHIPWSLIWGAKSGRGVASGVNFGSLRA